MVARMRVGYPPYAKRVIACSCHTLLFVWVGASWPVVPCPLCGEIHQERKN